MSLRFLLIFISLFSLSLSDLQAQTEAKIKKLEGKLKSVSSGDEPGIRMQLALLYLKTDAVKALENANLALARAKKNRDNNMQAEAFDFIGDIYNQQNDQKNAIKHYEAELELREKMVSTEHMAKLYYTVASIYKSQGKLKRATEYFEKSLSIAWKLNIKKLIFSNYEALFSTNYDEGDYKEAMKYFKCYVHIKDSLTKAKKSKEMSEMTLRYEVQKQKKDEQIGELNELTGKQQLEIRTKELEISRKNMQRNFLMAVLGFILLITFLLVRLYSSKKKANIRLASQNAEIQQQKEEILAQIDELEEKSSIIEEKNNDITKSIEYALRIQQAILPTPQEITALFPESFILYKPKDIVSGDFYWKATTPDNRAFIAIADCTGHGVPGGFMSMIGMEKLNDIVNQSSDIKELHPAQILKLLDKEIKKTLRQGEGAGTPSDGMDIALCEFNFNNGNVLYAGANRPLWLVTNKGEFMEYAPVKQGIGGTYEHLLEYENKIITVNPDDMIYIFTDGYEDQFGGERKKKLMKKNMKILFTSEHHKTPESQCEFLNNYFISWKQQEMQVDDMLVVGIRYKFTR